MNLNFYDIQFQDLCYIFSKIEIDFLSIFKNSYDFSEKCKDIDKGLFDKIENIFNSSIINFETKLEYSKNTIFNYMFTLKVLNCNINNVEFNVTIIFSKVLYSFSIFFIFNSYENFSLIKDKFKDYKKLQMTWGE